MMLTHSMCTSKISTDFRFKKQNMKTKYGFVKVVYSVLVMKIIDRT